MREGCPFSQDIPRSAPTSRLRSCQRPQENCNQRPHHRYGRKRVVTHAVPDEHAVKDYVEREGHPAYRAGKHQVPEEPGNRHFSENYGIHFFTSGCGEIMKRQGWLNADCHRNMISESAARPGAIYYPTNQQVTTYAADTDHFSRNTASTS